MQPTIIIATGGTGGHIFPAQVVADKLALELEKLELEKLELEKSELQKSELQKSLGKQSKIIVFADKNYYKYHSQDKNYSFKIIKAAKLESSPLAFCKAAITIAFGVSQSLFWFLKYQPQIVVAFGGYATFPVLLAAVILRKKIILHEQNAHLGKVNRIFAKFSQVLALSFVKTDAVEEILSGRTKPKVKFTGNPVRPEIIALSQKQYCPPNLSEKSANNHSSVCDILSFSKLHQKPEILPTFNIFIFGGSGGAKIFSEILPKALFNLGEGTKDRLKIVMQCRQDQLHYSFNQYQSFNINITINSFFTDIDQQLSNADLVISRSGSSSLFELACAKKPMILVPFALAADNHQEKNAREIAKMSGAIVIKESEFTINKLTSTIDKLIKNPKILADLSANSFKFATPEAGENLTNLIIEQLK